MPALILNLAFRAHFFHERLVIFHVGREPQAPPHFLDAVDIESVFCTLIIVVKLAEPRVVAGDMDVAPQLHGDRRRPTKTFRRDDDTPAGQAGFVNIARPPAGIHPSGGDAAFFSGEADRPCLVRGQLAHGVWVEFLAPVDDRRIGKIFVDGDDAPAGRLRPHAVWLKRDRAARVGLAGRVDGRRLDAAFQIRDGQAVRARLVMENVAHDLTFGIRRIHKPDRSAGDVREDVRLLSSIGFLRPRLAAPVVEEGL